MTKYIERVKGDFTLIALLLIPVSVAINIVGFQLSQLLRLPIFLDSIGTILAGAIAGPWIGAITGALTNAVNGIFNPVYFAYTLTSVAVGVTAGLLSRAGMFKKLWKVLISGVIFTIVATVFSGFITAIVFGGATGGTGSIFTATLLAAGQNIFASVFTVQVFQEIGDKLISVVVVFLVIKGMPSRYLSKVKYGEQYIQTRQTRTRTRDLSEATR